MGIPGRAFMPSWKVTDVHLKCGVLTSNIFFFFFLVLWLQYDEMVHYPGLEGIPLSGFGDAHTGRAMQHHALSQNSPYGPVGGAHRVPMPPGMGSNDGLKREKDEIYG